MEHYGVDLFTMQTKWETQTGTLIDALANDVKFGGTKDTTAAARAYWIGTQTQLPGAQQQKVAAFTQMKTILLDYILDNTFLQVLQSLHKQLIPKQW